MPKFGPTGKYPDGMLGAHDAGELKFGVAKDSRGDVVINFGTEVSWLTLPPPTAIQLAKLLLKHAGASKIEISFSEED